MMKESEEDEDDLREVLNEVMGREDLIEDFDEDDLFMSADTFGDLTVST